MTEFEEKALGALQGIKDELVSLNAGVASLVDKQDVNTALQQSPVVRQMDWKLWVIANAICDSLIQNGTLQNDPRKPNSPTNPATPG